MEIDNPTYRQAQKQNTKSLILMKAYELFAEKGYSDTTMRLLARRAGVGLGTIFKHFADKPSLLVEAYQNDLGEIIAEAFRTIPEAGIKEQLLHLSKNIYEFYALNPAFSRTLIKESLFLEGAPGKALDQQLMTFLQNVSSLISKAIARGELSPETNSLLATHAFGAFYFSVLVMALKKPTFNVESELELLGCMLESFFSTCNRPA